MDYLEYNYITIQRTDFMCKPIVRNIAIGGSASRHMLNKLRHLDANANYVLLYSVPITKAMYIRLSRYN